MSAPVTHDAGRIHMTHCQNCGHGSHCGGTKYGEFRDGDNRPITIKICGSCQCEECCPDIKEEKEKWRQSKYSSSVS
mgnify:CR=1 FL=1